MIFTSYENNPIPQILSLSTPKKQKIGIKCIDTLITTTNFHQFTKDELNSLFSLLSNGQTLEVLKNEYNLKSEIIIPSISPLINENIQINDPNIKSIVSFYILRCSITFLSQNTGTISSSALKKMFQLLVYSIDNNNPNLTNLSKQIFLIILSTFIDKINPDMLEILKHFFNIIDGYFDESLIVLTSMTKLLLNQVDPNIDSFLLDYSSQFILKAKNFNEVKNSLKNSIFPLLDNFDRKAISFVSKIISKLEFNEISSFLQKVPSNLINYQKDAFLTIPKTVNSDNEIFTCDIEKVHSTQLLPFLKIDSFDSSYDINFSLPQFESKEYFSKELTRLLLNLRIIVENLPEANKLLSQLFIDLIKEEDKKIKENNFENNKLFDIAIMSLYVCNDDYLNLIILQSKIFAPNISTYEYKMIDDNESDKRKEYELIFSARMICFQQMRNLFSIIFPFLFSFYQYPLFVGDIFSFLINDHIPNLSTMTKQNRDLLLEQLYRIAGDYQAIQIRKLADQEKISYSRIEILFYILTLLKKEENSQLLIKNALFMQLIVSFMCEEKLRPIVLQSIEEIFTKKEFDLSDCFSDFIKFIIINNDDNKLRYDTLTSLNKIVSAMPDYKEYFNELVDPLIDSLNSISKSSENDKDSFALIYMKSIFKFVSLASIDSSITNTKKILSAIQLIEGDDPSDETFNTLLNAISGNNKKYLFQFDQETKSFLYEEIQIKYSSILGAFLKAFQKSSKFIGILQMLKDSCLGSRNNAIKCHEGKIDLLLIDIIKEFIEKNKNNQIDTKNKDEDIVINALQLFSSIALISSSVEVVQNFFSLFNEVDYHVISIYQSIFYIILNDLTSMKDSFDVFLPLNSNSPVVQINGINNINVNNGFSIFLMVYISEMKNSSPKFYTIIDEKHNKIELFGENKALKLRMSGKNGEFVNVVNFDSEIFNYNEWNQIIISFKNNYNENKFNVSIVTNKSSKVYLFEQTFDLEKNNLNVIFGGTNPSIQSGSSDYSAIKTIGIYHMIEDEEKVELFNGLSNLIQNKTIATIDFLNKDNNLILSSNFPLQKINAKLVGPSVFITNSFKNVIINNDMLFMIFPLIFQNNCVLTDGQKTPDFCRVLYMILFNVLNSSLKAQILFYKSKGVDCLTHVLCNDESISFTNYQSIFQLFKKVKLMQLKMEIMNKILLNMSIWIHLDALSQLQIYRDWSRSLNTKYNDYTNRFINFGNLLRDLRTFYWFSPVEKNIIYTKRKEDLESKIVDIRSSILQILHTIAQRPELFGYNELALLISHCTTCRDTKQVLDLLSFIRLIIVSPETPLRNIDNLWSQFARLHSLLLSKPKPNFLKRRGKPPLLNGPSFHSNDEEDENDNESPSNESVILSVIDIFVTLHFLKIIENPEVNIHVSIIIDILPLNNITHQFFVKFFPFAMKYPEVTPLLFFLGMKMGEPELKIILNKVKPDVKFSSTKYWDLYSILFGLKYGGEKLDFISKFLAYSVHDNWDQVYQMITLIGSIFEIDTDDFKSNFLCFVCDNINNTPSLFYFEYLHNYFDIALFHIFFRNANEMSSSLNALFANSPFASECPEKVEKQKSSLDVSKKIFFEKLIGDSQKYQDQSTFQVVFGLRLDSEGHWLDRKLAIQLIQLSMKTKVQTFHNASSLLLAFLLREFPDDPAISNIIQQLISKRVIDKPFLDFLMSAYQKETFSKKNHFEAFETLLHDRLNINNSILIGISNLARNLEQLHANMKEETIEINKICSNKKESDEEAEEMQNNLIKKYSISKLFNKEYQLNEDLIKTVTKDKEYLQYKSKNFDEIRQNFFSDTDCLVKYKEIKVSSNENNNENHVQTVILNPIGSNYFRPKNTLIKKEKSVMLLSTPQRMKYSSHFYDDSTPFGKISEISDENHTNQICVNALYYPQNNPIHSTKVKFTVIASKIVISNKQLIHTSIFNSHLVFKELDASEIKKMIFMPLHNMPIGMEIVTKYPKKVYYITLVSNDALAILKTIASFKEFKNVLIQTQLPNFFFKSLGITKKWKEGRMSNFQYLMKLNRYSGRSFCNADSYPIFPRLKIPSVSEGNETNFTLRNLNEPINPNSPISDAFTVISLLSQRLPFSKELAYENNNLFKSPRSPRTPRSPRRTPKKSVFNITSSTSDTSITNNNSNTNISTDSSNNNININSSSNNIIINSNSSINSNTNNAKTLTEMTPEFFYDLKFFKPSSKDGKNNEEEVRNSFDTIYKRRKLLEESNIADFVDLVWGIKRKMYNSEVFCFLPFQLFKSHHPIQQKKKNEQAQNQTPEENTTKKPLISYKDELHEPIFIAHEMSSFRSVNNEDHSSNYVYSFACVDKKNGVVYRVDIDLNSKSITSKETWSKLLGNVFSSTKINMNKQKSNLFLGISLRSIFSNQTSLVKIDTTQNDEEVPIDFDTTTTIDASSSSKILREGETQNETNSKTQNETNAEPDFELTIVSAFSFSQKSSLMNLNDALKKFSYKNNQTEMFDSEIVNGVEILASDKEIVAAAGKMGSVVNIYKDFKFLRLVPTLRGKITALAVSSSFGIVVATTADGFLVIMSIDGCGKSHVISQKSVDLHVINEKHRNSTKSEVHGEVKSEVHGEVKSEVVNNSFHDLFYSHIYTPKKILVTRKWGFIVVYSEIDESVEKVDTKSHRIKKRKSKLSPGSFKTLSSFLHHDTGTKNELNNDKSNSHYFNEEDTSIGVIDIFTSSGDFIRREFINFSIRCWFCFSNSNDFDFITAADEDGKIYVFEAYYANIGKPIYQLIGKEIDFLFVEIPYSNVFAFSSNGDVDVIPIPYQ